MALKCTYFVTIGATDGLKAKTDYQLSDPLAGNNRLFVLTSAENFHGSSYPYIRGFAAEIEREQTVQETPVQGSLRRKPERKICTSCNVDKPASDFRASGTSRDGVQHFCIPCKVIEAKAVGMAAPSTRVTASEAVCAGCKELKPGGMGSAGADLEHDEEDCCHVIIHEGLAMHRHSDVLRISSSSNGAEQQRLRPGPPVRQRMSGRNSRHGGPHEHCNAA
ncbi:g7854 [Coccomyxa elongata]